MERLDVERLVAHWSGDRHYLIEMLQAVQDHYHYLPREILEELCDRLEVPLTRAYHVATFFKAFSLTPRGKHICQICTGTACHVQGAPKVMDAFERETGLKPGETDDALEFTVEGVRCVGCCGLAPVVVVGEDVHAKVTASGVKKLLETYRTTVPA